MQRVNSPVRDPLLVGSVVSDIKYDVSSISSVLFKHICRQSNVLAHDLTKSCMNYGLCVFENTRQTTLHARCMHDLQSDGCEALYSLIQWLDVERRSCIVQKRRVYSSSLPGKN